MEENNKITAQLSLYPLGRNEYLEEVDDAIATLRASGLEVRVGPLSTVVSGDAERVLEVVTQVFRRAVERGRAVLTVTLAGVPPEEILGGKYTWD